MNVSNVYLSFIRKRKHIVSAGSRAAHVCRETEQHPALMGVQQMFSISTLSPNHKSDRQCLLLERESERDASTPTSRGNIF